MKQMKTLVVYSSLTGNTKQVAQAIFKSLPEGTKLVAVEDLSTNLTDYDLVFVGFWVDRGTADKKAANLLAQLPNKKVALFATLGAYPESEHAQNSLDNAAALLPEGSVVVNSFICQGKIAKSLAESFKKYPAGHPHAMTPERIAKHQEASKHPDEQDFKKAAEFAKQTYALVKGTINE